MQKVVFLILTILIGLFNVSCHTNQKRIGLLDLEKYSFLHDTSYLDERLNIYSKIGFKNYMNYSTDSTYIRIRIAAKYNDSTEYFEFGGNINIEFATQSYVDKINLGIRNEYFKYSTDNIAKLYLGNFLLDDFIVLFLNEHHKMQPEVSYGGIEYQIEFLKDSKYLRLIFPSYLYHVSG